MAVLLDDMMDQVTDVLDAVPVDTTCVLVVGLDERGELYLDTNIANDDLKRQMLLDALEKLRNSLD